MNQGVVFGNDPAPTPLELLPSAPRWMSDARPFGIADASSECACPERPVHVFRQAVLKTANAVEEFARHEHIAGTRETQLCNVAAEVEVEDDLEGFHRGWASRIDSKGLDPPADEV